jgi:hypothetical protein
VAPGAGFVTLSSAFRRAELPTRLIQDLDEAG